MSVAITFTYGATTVTLNPAKFNDIVEVTRTQVRSRTHDGNLVVGDKDLTITRRLITLNDVSDSKKAELVSFFGEGTVNGSMNTFTYVDHDGSTHEVRLLNGSLAYVNVFLDLWNIDLTLEDVVSTGS